MPLEGVCKKIPNCRLKSFTAVRDNLLSINVLHHTKHSSGLDASIKDEQQVAVLGGTLAS
jgi:hypothetical protein